MTTTQPGPVATVRRLRATLDTIADALASARLDSLLTAETELASVVAHLPSIGDVPDEGERSALQHELSRAAAALTRCRRLGESLGHFVHCSLLAQGRAGGYDRSGHETTHAHVGALNVRG